MNLNHGYIQHNLTKLKPGPDVPVIPFTNNPVIFNHPSRPQTFTTPSGMREVQEFNENI